MTTDHHVTSIYVDEAKKVQKSVVRGFDESGKLVLSSKRQYYHSLEIAGEFHSLEALVTAITEHNRRKR